MNKKNKRKPNFSDEVTPSTYALQTPPKDFKILEFTHQIELWSEIFPNLKHLSNNPPQTINNICIIPKFNSLNQNYEFSFKYIVTKIQEARNVHFSNHSPLRLTSRLHQMYEQFSSTEDDFVFFEIQDGMKYRSKSNKLAEYQFEENEFGLGPFEIASFLLLHPNRLNNSYDLSINAPGVEIFCKENYEEDKKENVIDDGWSQNYTFNTKLTQLGKGNLLSMVWDWNGFFSQSSGAATGFLYNSKGEKLTFK